MLQDLTVFSANNCYKIWKERAFWEEPFLLHYNPTKNVECFSEPKNGFKAQNHHAVQKIGFKPVEECDLIHPRSLTACPWMPWCLEDEAFPFGMVKFHGLHPGKWTAFEPKNRGWFRWLSFSIGRFLGEPAVNFRNFLYVKFPGCTSWSTIPKNRSRLVGLLGLQKRARGGFSFVPMDLFGTRLGVFVVVFVVSSHLAWWFSPYNNGRNYQPQLTCYTWNPMKNGINYQPQLTCYTWNPMKNGMGQLPTSPGDRRISAINSIKFLFFKNPYIYISASTFQSGCQLDPKGWWIDTL